MATKEKIYPGDTFPIIEQGCKHDEDDPFDSECIPDAPASAYVRLFNKQAGAFVALGGGLTLPAPATVDGTKVRYTLPSAFTAEPGSYVLFITAVFPDGEVRTKERLLTILDYR